MPKASKGGFYAVNAGRNPGVYTTWADCEAQVKGFAAAKYKKFPTYDEAKQFVDGVVEPGSSSAASAAAASGGAKKPSARLSDPSSKVGGAAAAGVVADAIEDARWDGDVVYCDGACSGNGKIGAQAGIGVWYGPQDSRNLSERCPGDQTNNRAELIAIVRILESIPADSKTRVLIKTDSKYSIQCVKDWIKGWRQRGWRTSDGSPVKNEGVIQYLDALLVARANKGQTIEFKHVAGHRGIVGNEAADKLAVSGANLPQLPERDWAKEMRLFQMKEAPAF